ncbi:MAG TPA: histidine phosphatase family protein [Spirochaetota bacterium]|nr:histidine phosphatase family protein [Spirochaetota bacterium]
MKQNPLNIPDISTPVAIMVRHAERYPIGNMENALELLLTAKGKEDAFTLGWNLSGFSPLSIYHSPVPRCKETADSIRDGILSANQKATVEGLLLDLGGPYITGDWYAVVKAIEEIGHARFIRKWFNNELPASLIMSLPEAARIQLKILIHQLHTGSNSTINVTHDWNIMIMREYFLHLRHEDIGDPDYLDGLYAFIEKDRVHLGYHGTVIVPDLEHIEA